MQSKRWRLEYNGMTYTLAQLAKAAMEAGLDGRKLPNLGTWPQSGREQVAMINTVYELARNWAAGGAKSTGTIRQ